MGFNIMSDQRVGDNPVWQDVWTCRGLNEGEQHLGVLTFSSYAEAETAADNIYVTRYSDIFNFIEITVKRNLKGDTFTPVKIASLSEATDEESFMIKPTYAGENEDVDTKAQVESKAREYMEAERLQSDYGVVYRQYTTETFEGEVLWEPVTE
jgi:hypothetical protein